MFDWIPIEAYTPIYYHIILIMVLMTFFHTQLMSFDDVRNIKYITVTGFFLFWFVFLYMGLRPIHGIFTDMKTYANTYYAYQDGSMEIIKKDFFFQGFMYLCSRIMPASSFFFLCAAIYVLPLYLISKKWFGQYWYYSFLVLVASFSFWAYGTNGIRNGLATSIFLYALSKENKIIQGVFFLLAIAAHASMQLPVLGYVITMVYNKPKAYTYLWIGTIPLSLLLSGYWENLFSTLVDDDRASYLTDDTYASAFSSTGFRWDFLAYSFSGVYAGWYYIFKKKLSDKVYYHLYNTFLFANSFWILVIRASFSNRFAYLSWFLLALVIVYPWLKYQFVQNQSRKFGFIMLAYFCFTYFMNVILKL